MERRIRKCYSLSQPAIDIIEASAAARDIRDSTWLNMHIMAQAKAKPAAPGIPANLVKVTVVAGDIGKTVWMLPADAGLPT